jgi:hypothetical protein
MEIGPTYQEMISSSSANKRWRLSFQKWYSLPSHIQTLREASEAYSLVLLDMEDWEVAKICSTRLSYMYTKGYVAKSTWDGDERTWDHLEPDDQIVPQNADFILSSPLLADSNLVNEQQGPRMFLGSDCMMGLAPFDAAPGDKICQFWKSNVAALLRKEKDTSIYRLIGRVDLSMGYLDDLKPKYREPDELPQGTEAMIIQMDIKTLSVLTC